MHDMRATIAAILLSGSWIGGCTTTGIETPSGYVPLQNTGDKSFLAVSARGNTLGISERVNEGGKPADLAYWTEAFKHEKVELGRYRLNSEQSIRTDQGRDGMILDLRLGQGAAEYTWLVALFVDPSRVVTVEAGGPTRQIAPDRDKLVAAIRTLH